MVVVGLAVLVLGILGAVLYARHQDEAAAAQDARDSRRQDYALCIIQNENRQDINRNTRSIRKVAGALYSVLAARIANDPPTDPKTLQTFKTQTAILTRQLQALERKLPKIDCSTYVRPDLPPDTGSTTGVQ